MAKERKKRSMLGTFIIASIAYIVLGVFMIASPGIIVDGINVVFGIVMLIYGIINVITFFLNKDTEENLFLELALGVIAVGLGVFSLFAPLIIQKIVFYTIGAILVIDGLVNTKRAISLKSMGAGTIWLIMLISAAISVILGILSIVFYMNAAAFVVVFIGVALVYDGIAGLLTMLAVSRTKKKVEKELALTEQND